MLWGAGIAAIGSSWDAVEFDNITLDATRPIPADSWLHELLLLNYTTVTPAQVIPPLPPLSPFRPLHHHHHPSRRRRRRAISSLSSSPSPCSLTHGRGIVVASLWKRDLSCCHTRICPSPHWGGSSHHRAASFLTCCGLSRPLPAQRSAAVALLLHRCRIC